MSQIMKAYLGLFLFLLLTFTSAGFLGAYLQVLSAQDMHARIIDEVEYSDFFTGVIREAFEEADAAGYELRITIFDDSGKVEMKSKKEVPAAFSNASLGRVELSFPFEIPFLGIRQQHVFTAYAR